VPDSPNYTSAGDLHAERCLASVIHGELVPSTMYPWLLKEFSKIRDTMARYLKKYDRAYNKEISIWRYLLGIWFPWKHAKLNKSL
jgi:hypothetical protein